MTTKHLFTALEHYYPDYTTTSGCSELGYDDKPVILADWNHVPAKLFDMLENHGFSCEWDDEWLICDSCYKAFRSSPDSYGWEMYGYIGDGYAVCGDCIEWDEYLESLENKSRKAVTCTLFSEHESEITSRYELVKAEFENGFYDGQNDNPATILESLLKVNPNGRYLFVIDDQGQFDIEFSVYVRKPAEE